MNAPLTGEENEGVEKGGDAEENSTNVEELLQAKDEEPDVRDQAVYQKPRTWKTGNADNRNQGPSWFISGLQLF